MAEGYHALSYLSCVLHLLPMQPQAMLGVQYVSVSLEKEANNEKDLCELSHSTLVIYCIFPERKETPVVHKIGVGRIAVCYLGKKATTVCWNSVLRPQRPSVA